MATVQNTPGPSKTSPNFQEQLVNSISFVFHVNLFIWGILAVVALIRLPRLVGLFGTTSDWYTGHFVYYSEPKHPKPSVERQDSTRTIVGRHNSTKSLGRNNSTTKTKLDRNNSGKTTVARHNSTRTQVEEDYYDQYQRRFRSGEKAATVERVDLKAPPHFAAVPPQLRSVRGLARTRVFEGYSVGKLFILSNYFYCLVYALFYKSNPFVDATRPAWVSVSQLPLLFALAQRNNLVGSALGYGYEKLNFVHRFVGRLVILAADLHCVFYFYRWTMTESFTENLARPTNAWGFVALFFMNVMIIFSTDFWRQNAYNVFLWTHTISIIVVLPSLYMHQPSLLPYILASVFLYTADRVMRVLKTRIATATILPLPEMGATHVEISSLNAGWRPGQHVRLRVLSRGMGWFGWTETHPFTIATASESHDGLVLMCKEAGDWTKRLGLMAKGKGYEGGESQVKVWVEGPYGGPGRMLFASFSAAVVVVAGSGITFGLSMIQDLIEKDVKGESRVKYVELVWVTADASSVAPLVPVFTSLIQQSIYSPLRISIHYTRATTSKLPFNSPHSDNPHYPISLHPSLTLTPGRPRVGRAIDSAIAKAVSLGSEQKEALGITGLAVGVCGPRSLADEVVKAVAAVDPARRDQVGGIEIHEEAFGT